MKNEELKNYAAEKNAIEMGFALKEAEKILKSNPNVKNVKLISTPSILSYKYSNIEKGKVKFHVDKAISLKYLIGGIKNSPEMESVRGGRDGHPFSYRSFPEPFDRYGDICIRPLIGINSTLDDDNKRILKDPSYFIDVSCPVAFKHENDHFICELGNSIVCSDFRNPFWSAEGLYFFEDFLFPGGKEEYKDTDLKKCINSVVESSSKFFDLINKYDNFRDSCNKIYSNLEWKIRNEIEKNIKDKKNTPLDIEKIVSYLSNT